MRGDIVELKNDPKAKGHEQRGRRYAVIVQSEYLHTSTVIVVPTTSNANADAYAHRPKITIPRIGESVVLVEQIRAVDRSKGVGRTVGHVLHAELVEIEEAMRLVLALDDIEIE